MLIERKTSSAFNFSLICHFNGSDVCFTAGFKHWPFEDITPSDLLLEMICHILVENILLTTYFFFISIEKHLFLVYKKKLYPKGPIQRYPAM